MRRCAAPCLLAAGLLVSAMTWAAAAQPARQAAAPPAAAPQATQAPPNALQGFSQNRDQPVKIESARLEVRDKEKKATFLGDVHLTQGDTTLTCKTLVVHYEQNAAPSSANPATARTASMGPGGGGQSQIRRVEALGDVVVVQKDQTATGNSGIFDMRTNTITLEGNVAITQGQNVVTGEKVTVDITTGVSKVEPGKGSNGRVKALFQPSNAGGADPLQALTRPKEKPAKPN